MSRLDRVVNHGCKLNTQLGLWKTQDGFGPSLLPDKLCFPSAFKPDLDEGTFKLTILKGDTSHYRQGLIKSLRENAT